LAAGVLFVIPGALVMLGLSLLYVLAAGLPWLAGLFLGIKAAVLAIVAQALQRVAKRALTGTARRVIAIIAFVALAAFAAPFPLVILGAGVAGAVIGKFRPDWLGDGHASAAAILTARGPLIGQTARTILVWSAVWWAPMALVAATLGTGHPLWSVGTFFARLAVVSFGGAYAVLGYMAQATVGHYGWLTAADMANGMGLAETTPGPLIMVTQFVGFLAGWRHAAPMSALWGGLAAAALTTWMTFAPCFLWIFAAAPWLERLEHAPRLHAALAAITAAVVGVIASLALWFAIHVLLRGPGLANPDWPALGIAVASGLLLFWRKWDIVAVLGVAAGAGLALGLVA
jgi:chromate transporter